MFVSAPSRDGFGERDLRSLTTNSSFGGASARNNILSSGGPKSSDTVIVDNVSWNLYLTVFWWRKYFDNNIFDFQLPHNFTWQNLKDKFRDVGNIKFAEMRGKLGLIRFASEWEALRAVCILFCLVSHYSLRRYATHFKKYVDLTITRMGLSPVQCV